jgi:two-component system OmpR family response regulator
MKHGSCRSGNILIVDDDPDVKQMVGSYFTEHNLPTVFASNWIESEQQIAANDPSLIILDLKLGGENGLDLLRSLRSRSEIPIIIITGYHLGEIDRIVGLELGADDYLAKPFNLRELLARVRAVLRRQDVGRSGHARGREKGGYRFGGWRLERSSRRLFDPDGTRMPLTRGEYTLLLAFLEAPQRVLSREQLLKLTRIREDIFDRSVDTQILRLRRKLEPDLNCPRVIQTERGVGYVFTLPVEPL